MRTKFIFLAACFVVLISSSNPSYAQSSGGLGFFSPGIHTIQYSELNALMPAGYPQITNKPFVTSGTGYGIFSNIVIGGEGGTMHAGSFALDNQLVDLSGEFGFFSLGYVVLNRKGLVVFPTAGIGTNDLAMYIHQKDQNASFENVTGEPFQSTTLRYHSKMLKFSLTGLYPLQNRSDKGASGLMLGLQVGYQMSYKPGVWTYDNGSITDGPEFSHNAFFIQLMIGGGGLMQK